MSREIRDSLKWFGTTVVAGLLVNWLATATWSWAVTGYASIASLAGTVFTWPNLLASFTTVLTVGLIAIPVGIWMRKDRLNDMARAREDGKKAGYATGRDDGYKEGLKIGEAAGIKEGHRDAQPKNVWSTYARVLEALVSQHDNLNAAMSELRSLPWKSYVNGQMLNVSEPMVRIWNRLIEYRFQNLFEHKQVTEGEFRTLIHLLNEFNNSIFTYKSMIRHATDRRKTTDPLYPEDYDGPLDVSVATDKWDSAIKQIEDQIRAWNKMNAKAESITWGFTACERLMAPPTASL